ncbi:MAG: cardiolipin synthase [Bacillaceae bacterium]
MKKFIKLIIFLVAIGIFLYFFNHFFKVTILSAQKTDSIGNIWGIMSIFFAVSSFFIGVIIFLENRNPTKTLIWIIALSLVPLVGFFAYLWFGQNYRRKRMFQKKALEDQLLYAKYWETRGDDLGPTKILKEYALVYRLARKHSKSPISQKTITKVLTNGQEKFDAVIESLEQAEKHIHLEYYIVRDDGIGRQIKDILIRKAKAGVKVRFLYDAVGSLSLPKSYVRDLQDAGVQMVSFFPVKIPILNDKINYRNHRKIIVIDSYIGYVGGINIGDEYLGKVEQYGFWRDTHLQVVGDAVQNLQFIFMQDWYYMTGEVIDRELYVPIEHNIGGKEDEGGVQIISGGPDTEWETLKQLFFALITSARQSIWIATPYFIPDEDILSAIKIAAIAGIDVRILMPGRPDKKLVFNASRSYFQEMLEAGAKIYEYKHGFMHSKIIIVDGKLASIGTANMDMRSFHLNFEINAFLYGTDSTCKLVEDFKNDIQESNEIELEVFRKRSLWQRIAESFSRLLSPLL